MNAIAFLFLGLGLFGYSTMLCAQDSSAHKETTIEKYQLILFPFDSPALGAHNKHIMTQYIYPRCFVSSDVQIAGYCDIIGQQIHNNRLAAQRAANVQKSIHENATAPKDMNAQGMKRDNPLYTNQLPEGRFYNRTVFVTIHTPIEDAHLEEQADNCGE